MSRNDPHNDAESGYERLQENVSVQDNTSRELRADGRAPEPDDDQTIHDLASKFINPRLWELEAEINAANERIHDLILGGLESRERDADDDVDFTVNIENEIHEVDGDTAIAPGDREIEFDAELDTTELADDELDALRAFLAGESRPPVLPDDQFRCEPTPVEPDSPDVNPWCEALEYTNPDLLDAFAEHVEARWPNATVDDPAWLAVELELAIEAHLGIDRVQRAKDEIFADSTTDDDWGNE